jgi:potassium efflux system protein
VRQYCIAFALFIFSIFALTQIDFAFADANITLSNKEPLLLTAVQELSAEKVHHALLVKKLHVFQSGKQQMISVSVDAGMLQRADLAIAWAQADLEGITLTLSAAEQTVVLTENNLTDLQNQAQDATVLTRSSSEEQAKLHSQIAAQQALLSLQQARVEALQETQNLAQQMVSEAQDTKIKLLANYELQQQQARQQALDQLAADLQTEQQKWLSRLTALDQQLQQANAANLANTAQYAELEAAIFEAEERSNLSQVKLDLARLHNRLQDLALPLGQMSSLSTLNNLQHQMDTLSEQLKNTKEMLNNKISLLQERVQLNSKVTTISPTIIQSNAALLTGLLTSYQKQLAQTISIETQARAYQAALTQQLSQQLSNRQGLPGFDLQAWLLLSGKLVNIPSLTWQTLHSLRKPIIAAFKNAPIWQWCLWFFGLGVWIVIGYKAHCYLNQLTIKLEEGDYHFFAADTFLVCLKLIRYHFLLIFIILGFAGSLLMMGISLQLFSLVIELALVLLVFRVLITLTRLLLFEGTTDKSGDDVRLYYRLKWALHAGGLLTALTILVHQLPISYGIQDLFDRFFMLFLLVVAIVLFKARKLVPTLLEPYLANKHPYLKQVVRWLSFLIPITLLTNSILGLAGYVELTWSMATYESIFLILLTIYLVARGLLAVLMSWSAEYIIRLSRHGWLWTEALLKPAHQVMKFLLAIGAVFLLFYCYGWGKHSFVMTEIDRLLHWQLFVIAGTVITPLSIIELAIIFAILFWAARWAREFAYRWLFARTKDVGLRNSLSIFTQYLTVGLGSLLALRIIGINVTALTVIASAFAFGVGLGLRDLTNNFICGLLLLIERPVRVGDYISVGDYEGEVRNIGMRSITVTTDDNKELLVPNADAFSKTFVNWTHRDTVIRTVFTLKINRVDDPHHVRNVILDVIRNMSKIVTHPPAQVYFKKMQDVLLEFEIDYFVDIRKGASRSTVHSELLFALWDRFKTENIHPPEHPHEIYVQGSLVPVAGQ